MHERYYKQPPNIPGIAYERSIFLNKYFLYPALLFYTIFALSVVSAPYRIQIWFTIIASLFFMNRHYKTPFSRPKKVFLDKDSVTVQFKNSEVTKDLKDYSIYVHFSKHSGRKGKVFSVYLFPNETSKELENAYDKNNYAKLARLRKKIIPLCERIFTIENVIDYTTSIQKNINPDILITFETPEIESDFERYKQIQYDVNNV